MEIHEYARKYDAFAFEEAKLEIPFRKKFVLNAAGRGRCVLDVGCNSGKLAQAIAKQNNEVWAIEINPEAAQLAEARGLRIKVANAADGLPFDDCFFDMVHAGSMFEALYDTEAFAAECMRVLKPGGDLVLSFFNLNSWDNRFKILTGNYISKLGAYPHDRNGDRLRIFNLAKLKELLLRSGFEWGEARGIPVAHPTNPLLDQALGLAGRLLPEMSQQVLIRVKRPRTN